jgi:NTP pyrophosphatase (non-canonical NTP hydrolase)
MSKLENEVKQWMKERYKDMDVNVYQDRAVATAIYPETHKITYPALGMAGEAGEVANKVKKIIRDGKKSLPDDWQEQLASEIGDVLWYCAALARDLDMSLATIMAANLDKLKARQEQGTLGGSGDKR